MKLLRLTSDRDDGQFINEFNDIDITVNPFSKIALHSLTFDVIPREITINNNNNELYITYTDNNTQTIELDSNTYTADNVSFLLQDLRTQLNNSLNAFEPNCLGCEWDVLKNNDNKIQIINNRVNLLYRFQGEVFYNATYTNNDPGYITTSTNNEVSWVGSTQYICKGASLFKIKPYLIDFSENFSIILTETNPKTIKSLGGGSIDNYSFFQVYVMVNLLPGFTDTGLYLYNKDIGEYTKLLDFNFTNPDLSNNELYFSITEGNINAYFNYWDNDYQGTGQEVQINELLHSIPYTDKQQLFPIIQLPSTNTTPNNAYKCSVEFTPSPKNSVSNDYIKYEVNKNSNLLTLNPTQDSPDWSRNTYQQRIIFQSSIVSQFLGFESPTLPYQLSSMSNPLNYLSTYTFKLNSVNDSFIVELFEYRLASYDGYKKGRFNILSVIPSVELLESGIVYEANNLIWIDFLNVEPFNLRNVRMRILQRDHSPVNIRGLAVATLLIKDKDE